MHALANKLPDGNRRVGLTMSRRSEKPAASHKSWGEPNGLIYPLHGLPKFGGRVPHVPYVCIVVVPCVPVHTSVRRIHIVTPVKHVYTRKKVINAMTMK